MSLVQQYNKERDVTYVYESQSYWDKEKKQPRSRRKLIGKLDPETGEIVPTGKPGRKRKSQKNSSSAADHSDTEDYKVLYNQCLAECNRKDSIITDLKKQVADLSLKSASDDALINEIRKLVH